MNEILFEGSGIIIDLKNLLLASIQIIELVVSFGFEKSCWQKRTSGVTLIADCFSLGDLFDSLSKLFQIGKGTSHMEKFI